MIPSSGFYEWDRYKSKYRFTSADGGILLLAGFYREEQDKPRFTILTTEANDSMINIHDRMPLMISRNEISSWIDDDSRLPDFLSRRQTELVCEMDTGQMRMDFGI